MLTIDLDFYWWIRIAELLIEYKRSISRSLGIIFMSMNWWRWASLGWTDFAEVVLDAHWIVFGLMTIQIRWNCFLIWRMNFFKADPDIFSGISKIYPLHLNQQDQLFLWAFLLYGYRCRVFEWFWMCSLDWLNKLTEISWMCFPFFRHILYKKTGAGRNSGFSAPSFISNIRNSILHPWYCRFNNSQATNDTLRLSTIVE